MAKKSSRRRRDESKTPPEPKRQPEAKPEPVIVVDCDETDADLPAPGYVPASEAATEETGQSAPPTPKGPVPRIVAHCVDHTPVVDLRKCARLMVQRWQHLPPAAAADAVALVSDAELDAIMRTQLQPKFGQRLAQLLDDCRQRDAAERRRKEQARATKPKDAVK